jgi:Domain of unknown function (DU1801)
VHAADPEVSETIKRSRQPYFVLQGDICALLAARDHVNVFVYDGGIVPDPDGIVTAGHDNKTARTVAIRQGEAINAPALSAMFKHIMPATAPAAGANSNANVNPQAASQRRAHLPQAGRGPFLAESAGGLVTVRSCRSLTPEARPLPSCPLSCEVTSSWIALALIRAKAIHDHWRRDSIR